jgi:hypothetical protein
VTATATLRTLDTALRTRLAESAQDFLEKATARVEPVERAVMATLDIRWDNRDSSGAYTPLEAEPDSDVGWNWIRLSDTYRIGEAVYLMADAAGTATVALMLGSFADFPAAVPITNATPATLSGQRTAAVDATTWERRIAVGDVLHFRLAAVDGAIKKLVLDIPLRRTPVNATVQGLVDNDGLRLRDEDGRYLLMAR